MTEAAAVTKLPDAQMLKLAAQSMFDMFAGTAMGSMLVDRQHRIVWISESYKQFLPALGFDSAEKFVGKRVEEVVPNTLMNQVIDTGKPILVDLLSNQAGTFLVSRLPLRNVLEQATLMTDDPALGVAHFGGLLPKPAEAASAAAVAVSASTAAGFRPLPQAVAELEAALIDQALTRTGGNKLAAAKLLGISRATLYQKLPLVDTAAHNRSTQTGD